VLWSGAHPTENLIMIASTRYIVLSGLLTATVALPNPAWAQSGPQTIELTGTVRDFYEHTAVCS
jgi:hypothetical protein